jgi:hypothetical protein
MDDDGRLFADRLRAVVPTDTGQATPVRELERLAKSRHRRRRVAGVAAAATSVALLSGGVYVAVGANARSDQAASGPSSTGGSGGYFGDYRGRLPSHCPDRTSWIARRPGEPNLKAAHIVMVEACTYRYRGGSFNRTSLRVTSDPGLVRRLYAETLASNRGLFTLSCTMIPADAKKARTAKVLVLSDGNDRYPFFYEPFCVNPAWPSPPAHAMLPAAGLTSAIGRMADG